MHKLFLSGLSVLLLLFSCQKSTDNTNSNTETENNELTKKDISNIKYVEFVLDESTTEAIADWLEYNQLQDVVNNVKQADLSFFYKNNETVKNALIELKKTIPNLVNTPPTVARISALETKLLKLEDVVNLSTTGKQELLAVIEEFLVAFSNLNFQMNKKLEKDRNQIEKP